MSSGSYTHQSPFSLAQGGAWDTGFRCADSPPSSLCNIRASPNLLSGSYEVDRRTISVPYPFLLRLSLMHIRSPAPAFRGLYRYSAWLGEGQGSKSNLVMQRGWSWYGSIVLLSLTVDHAKHPSICRKEMSICA